VSKLEGLAAPWEAEQFPVFKPWPKLPRLFRDVIITEKIDGTNAAVIIGEDGGWAAQSRNRLISPSADNAGFAGWVWDNGPALAEILGPGYHYGEWWGQKIGRNYGLGHRRFSLFNTTRWQGAEHHGSFDQVPELGVVPVLYQGPFSTDVVTWMLEDLRDLGSVAAPGFENPEGVVVFHTAANSMFKVTLENDDNPKSVLPGRGEFVG
jgi:hypothetical protein